MIQMLQLRVIWNLSHLVLSPPTSRELCPLQTLMRMWHPEGECSKVLAYRGINESSLICLCPPLGLFLLSLTPPLRSCSTCICPLKRDKCWTGHPRSTTTHHASCPTNAAPPPLCSPYSQRKSPFPEAISLCTLRSRLKCELWTQTGTGSAACVCAAAHMWLSNMRWKPPCFLCLPFDWRCLRCVFSCLFFMNSLLCTLLAFLDLVELLLTHMHEIWWYFAKSQPN